MNAILTRRQLAHRLGCSTRTLDRDRAAGTIPDPLPRPGKNPRWLETEIENWIAAGMPDRDTWERIRARSKR